MSDPEIWFAEVIITVIVFITFYIIYSRKNKKPIDNYRINNNYRTNRPKLQRARQLRENIREWETKDVLDAEYREL